MSNRVQLSIITPCFIEESSIEICINEVARVMKLHLPTIRYEHIISDNASVDGTLNILKRLDNIDKNLKIIVNSRNIGTSKNIYRAMSRASGDCVVPMLPADLQDPPEIIYKMFEEWNAGAVVIFGQRTNRQESLLMRTCRSIYYRAIRKMSMSDIPVNAGDFMLIDRQVVKTIVSLKDHNPYLRGIIAQLGLPSAFVKYTWVKRNHGKSKSSFLLLIDTAINGLVSTSRLPARIALLVGFMISVLGILFGSFSLISSLLGWSDVANGISTLLVAMFFIGGVQLFFLGLIGEYVLSIHGQVRPEPEVTDQLLINF